MSGPFVYSPAPAPTPVLVGGYYPTPYTQGHYGTPVGTPYIPDPNLYQPSPGRSSNPGTPRQRVRFADLHPEEQPTWPPQVPKERRPSWHSQNNPAMSGLSQQGAFLVPPPMNLGHMRRRSSGDVPTPSPWSNNLSPLPPWASPAPQQGHIPAWASPATQYGQLPPVNGNVHLHPIIDAVALPAEFHLDLSYTSFRPLVLGVGTTYLSMPMQTLVQAATHPPLTRMRIVCESIPQWPIDLEFNAQFIPVSPGATMAIQPISVGDVLAAIYRGLQIPIKDSDFKLLDYDSERAVAKAYTKRCKRAAKEGPQAQGEGAKGVKRIDYLLDATLFRGLIPVAGSQIPTFKVVLG